jgi:outer membrane receptor protein involved in Fe transport
MKTILLKSLLLVFIFSVAACKTTSTTGSTTTNDDKEVTTLHSTDKESEAEKVNQQTNSPTSQLVDLFRRLPGVNIRGSHPNVFVSVRGVTSTSGATGVLYVVDNAPMGNEYARVAELVDVTRVKSVSVLKGGETAIYGKQGSGGVIVIKMKKDQED